MKRQELRNFREPDEVRTFDHGRVEMLKIGEAVVTRFTFEPGWRWSKHVKPLAGTDWCEIPHFEYQISGRMHVQLKDGKEFEIGPGEVAYLPAGHDGWVVGNEPVVGIDWADATNYAQRLVDKAA